MPDPAAPDGAVGSAGATAPETAPAASVGDTGAAEPRQSVVKSAGARRARLTPAPDTDTSPEPPSREEGGQTTGDGSSTSANDARLRQDKPPHW
ncbi:MULTISPECIES: hypothetical protein [Cryobacterium]|uniref:Uncharacterized protein n=1 Tax=Cryobacterium zongtaii TaxID=1259217 RepID=A0A2S3ZMZ8_9MICO|nr:MULTISPECIES: hypothetical protein [Cryobacterium]POH68690.1 hypothetical protein C3B60_05785 [Cryobacterium zongtaii]POH70310.1 hypothetical protein C3B61_01475 [Cryobacterium zongtaii]TFC49392.1 hypothetical protein E3O57_00105 [Cryobacterium sp. TMN-39-2]